MSETKTTYYAEILNRWKDYKSNQEKICEAAHRKFHVEPAIREFVKYLSAADLIVLLQEKPELVPESFYDWIRGNLVGRIRFQEVGKNEE